jgi:hypothetical protein
MLGATYLAVGVQDLGLVCVDVVAQVGVVARAEGRWHDDTDVLALKLTLLVPAGATTTTGGMNNMWHSSIDTRQHCWEGFHVQVET